MRSRWLFLSLAVALAAQAGEAPVIVKMMQRDRVITVRSDGGEPRYTIETAAGEVVVKDVKLDELKASNPKEYDLLKGTVASDGNGVLDASLGKPAPARGGKLDARVYP